MGNIYTGSNTGKAGLEVTDENGTPDVFGVSKIIVSDGTLTDNNDGSVTIQTGGGGGGGSVTSVDVSGGTTGLTTSGGPITGAGTITISGVLETTNGGTGLSSIGTANQFLRVNSLGTALEYATVNTGVDGSGSANQVAYWSDADTIAGDAGLTYTPTGGSRQLKITDNGVSDMFVIESTDEGATNAPDVKLYRNSATPTVDDVIGAIKFNANEGVGGSELTYARIESRIDSANPTNYGGSLDFYITNDAAEVRMLTISGEISGVPNMSFDVNPDGDVDGDFRHFSLGGTVNIFSDAQSRTLDIAPIKNYGFGGTATPLDGELLIGNGSTFSKANLTSTGGTITITNGGGTINLDTAVASYSNWRASDGSNTDEVQSGDTLTFTGGTGITTTLSGTGGATPTLTIEADGTSPTGTGATNQIAYWSGANTLTGDNDLTWDGQTLKIIDASDSTLLQVESTSANTGSAPDIVYYANRASPSDGDDLGVIVFKGNDSGGAAQEFARISAESNVVTAGSEDGQLDFRVFQSGSITSPMRITESGVFVNIANNANLDFVVDTLSQDFAFQVDASQDDIRTQVPFRDEIEIHSTDAGAAVAPDLKLYRNSATPATNDVLGQVLFSGQDDAAQKINYASITGFAVDVATAQPDGAIVFNCLRNGTSAPYFDIGKLVSGVRAMTVNPNALDNDFYIKTINQSEAFKMDGSADTATFNVPVTIFQKTTGTAGLALQIDDDGATASPDIKLFHNSTSPAANDDLGHIQFQGKNSLAATTTYADFFADILDPTDGAEAGRFNFRVRANTNSGNITDMLSIRGDGNPAVVVNDSGRADVDFRVETDNQTNAFLMDASADTATFNVPMTINQQSNALSTDFALQLTEDTDDANQSPDFFLYKNSATPANGDDIGSIQFYGNNAPSSGGAKNLKHIYGSIVMDMADVVTNQESGRMFIQILKAGTLRQALTIRGDGGSGSVVVGDGNASLGADGIDFRVETTSQNSAFTIDTSADQANYEIPVSFTGKINGYAGSNPANGQLLIGDGTDFEMANLTSTGGTVTITNGAGTINLEAAGGGGGGSPGGAGNDIQFNDGAGGFGGESRFTYNTTVPIGNPHIFTVGQSIGIGSGNPVNFFQTAGDSAGASGGTITSSTSELSAVFSKGFAPFNEINGFKYQPTDNQFKTGTTTTQSFGQTQNAKFAAGTYDCYPQQGGLIVVSGNAAAITLNLTLAQDGGGRYDANAPPFTNGGLQPAPVGTSDLTGYGTWQIGDQVTVLANLTPGQTPNITIRSYNSVYDPLLPALATPTDAPTTATDINGVNSSTLGGGQQTITTNFTAKTFVLVEDIAGATTLGVQWVCIG